MVIKSFPFLFFFDILAVEEDEVLFSVGHDNFVTRECPILDFTRIDQSDLSIVLSNPITDLIITLRNSTLGISILHHYRSHRNLTEEYRNDLVDIIISVEIRTSTELV